MITCSLQVFWARRMLFVWIVLLCSWEDKDVAPGSKSESSIGSENVMELFASTKQLTTVWAKVIDMAQCLIRVIYTRQQGCPSHPPIFFFSFFTSFPPPFVPQKQLGVSKYVRWVVRLNFTVSHSALNTRKFRQNVFSNRMNCLLACLKLTRRQFYTFWPAAAKHPHLKLLYVHLMTHILKLAEPSWQWASSETSWRWPGKPEPCWSVVILKSMPFQTGSRCSCCSTRVMWSCHPAPTTWTGCNWGMLKGPPVTSWAKLQST